MESEVGNGYYALIIMRTISYCFLITILIYRQLLTQISFDLLKFEGSNQIDQL